MLARSGFGLRNEVGSLRPRLLPRGEPNRAGYGPGAGSWEAAFEQAFGITLDEFYRHFESYRAALP